jgi:predicted ester cyclase
MQTRHLLLIASLAACATTANPTESSTMSTDANKQTIRRLYDECINPNRLDLLGDLVASDFVGPEGVHGPGGFGAGLTGLRAGFPDIHFTIDDLIAEGDRVTVRSTWHATHTGTFRGMAPTGKPVTNTSIAIYQLANHKLIHSWVESDRLGTLQQMGGLQQMAGSQQVAGPPSTSVPQQR